MIGMSLHGGVADYSWSDGAGKHPIPQINGAAKTLNL
jgi:hypothetical protein